MLICYADDMGVWYEITASNRETIIDSINTDLANVLGWATDNKTSFEPLCAHL
jgi:hypothetical protein